jgi:molybdenum cofactor synthesis domain-containing protein
MFDSQIPTACIIIIGNEILSGQTQDTNITAIAKYLFNLGIILKECRIIGDNEQDIITTVNDCRARYNYVFTTGGIGPTHDDITSRAISKAFNLPLESNAEAVKRIFSHIPQRGPDDARLRMADMPEGVILIDNPVSHAPGFQIENVFVLPGVPTITQEMLPGLTPRLQKGRPLLTKSLMCIAFESHIANELSKIQDLHPTVEIGSYPTWHISKERGVKIVFKGYDPAELQSVESKIYEMSKKLGYDVEEITL